VIWIEKTVGETLLFPLRQVTIGEVSARDRSGTPHHALRVRGV
jgi:hypothetical protein